MQEPNQRDLGAIGRLRANWAELNVYERFEASIVFVLTLLIALVIIVATWTLVLKIFHLVVIGVADPTDHSAFQIIFGSIFTVIIALEFKHSLLVMMARKQGIVAVKSVVLIALLAVLRKFIIMEVSSTPWETLLALAAGVLSLGIVYGIVAGCDRPHKSPQSF